MKPTITETSAGAILFRKRGSNLEFLLLQGITGGWGFAKGHLESDGVIENAKREVLEETGNDVDFLPNFHEKITYTCEFPKEISNKTIHFFLAESQSDIVLSKEHVDFKWVSVQEGAGLIKYDLQKNLLWKAHDFLERDH